MVEIKFSIVLLLIFLIGNVISVQVDLVLYDTSPDRNPDFTIPFETYEQEYTEGCIADYLNNDPVLGEFPAYLLGNSECLSDGVSKTLVFNETTWNDRWSYNPSLVAIEHMTLEIPKKGDGWYEYHNLYFNIFNGMGFDNKTNYPLEPVQLNNHHWCLKISFPFQPIRFSQTWVEASSSDDLWVYVDGVLQQPSLSGGFQDISVFVPLHTYPPNKIAQIDIFHCNRAIRDGSNGGDDLNIFGVSLRGEIDCSYIDVCGVCNGKNECCLDGITCVPDETICVNRYCLTQEVYDCVEEPFDCNNTMSTDQCHYPQCIDGAGCQQIPIVCEDSDPCTNDVCDPNLGCAYVPIDNCVGCGDDGCVTTDLCLPRGCDANDPTLCIDLPEINCTIDDPCIQGYCHLGICEEYYIPNCIESTSSSSPSSSSQSSSSSPSSASSQSSQSSQSASASSESSSSQSSSEAPTVSPTPTPTPTPTTTGATTGVTTSPITTTTGTTGVTTPTTTGATTSPVTTSTTTGNQTSTTTGLISTTGQVTGSTTSFYHPCDTHTCPSRTKCIEYEKQAICVDVSCLDCYDIDCPVMGLRCAMIEAKPKSHNNNNNKRYKKDNDETCCDYIPTCY
ncbi:hypothetical protein CYY_006767 [Polysphondylium violaceum]|uniref:PA14 domain-containing protein n=1 Tax=Polysphondylium violaceum TaxID=133409 RepID=A0A8J4UY22_9MYCE|nr:hypothetical protein CYY_006767 [Polysphondylium violaceum]